MKNVLVTLLLAIGFQMSYAQEESGKTGFGFAVKGKFGNARIESDGLLDRRVDFSGSDFLLTYDFKKFSIHAGYGVYNSEANLAYLGNHAFLEQQMITIPVGVTYQPDFGESKLEWMDLSLGLDLYGKTIKKSTFNTLLETETTRNYSWNFGTNLSCYVDFHLFSHVDFSLGIESYYDFGDNKKGDAAQKIKTANLVGVKFAMKI